MIHLPRLIALAILVLPLTASYGLDRDEIRSLTVEKIEWNDTSFPQTLHTLRAVSVPAGFNIQVAPEANFPELEVSLKIDAIDLDTLLEFLTSATGLQWTIRDGAILIFVEPDRQAAFQAYTQSPLHTVLSEVKIDEISFQQTPIADAFRQVREAGLATGGLGSLPPLNLSELDDNTLITCSIEGASVETLYDLLGAYSPRHHWVIGDASIGVIDVVSIQEAERAAAEAAKLAAIRAANAPKNQPAVDAFAPSGALSSPATYSLRSSLKLRKSSTTPLQPEDLHHNTESYARFGDNPFLSPTDEPLSTFAVDVDTASYTNIRRLIEQEQPIPTSAARIEEMLNYFPYDYTVPEADADHPFAVSMEVAPAPWATNHRLARIALKGYEVPFDQRPASNLVFLLDVSGSMDSENKLPLVKQSMRLLTKQLDSRDRVAIVVYAGAAGLVLPPTEPGDERTIEKALKALNAGGSTNGGQGIQLAYQTVAENFIEGGNNRVILCTDGDFNVGTTDQGSLVDLVVEKSKAGIFLTVAGFGSGNLNDDLMEDISNNGDGNYFYIDQASEARRVFSRSVLGTLITIAKDVKAQVEFNPSQVGAYRLIGYENRLLKPEDFDDDTVDAGEIGSGHSVTALYEIIPPGQEADWLRKVAPLKYQTPPAQSPAEAVSEELLHLKLRYKAPEGGASTLIEQALVDSGADLESASSDFLFASAVATFGMSLRDSDYKGEASPRLAKDLATTALDRSNSKGSSTSEDKHRSSEWEGFLKLVRSVD